MGFPPYLIGLGLPLLVGLLGLGWVIYNQESRRQRYSYDKASSSYDSGYDRPRAFSSSEAEKCPICLEEIKLEESSTLQCGHTLHAACLVELIRRHDFSCPVCRTRI